jgi:HUS1 checkpoint protein
VPLTSLHRALKSALQATSASIRLTKKDNVPLLALTIVTTSTSAPHSALPAGGTSNNDEGFGSGSDFNGGASSFDSAFARERETVVTQEVPVRVLSPETVSGLHEPRCREPDVHILLPPLLQLKGISDRFTKLALVGAKSGAVGGTAAAAATTHRTRLEMAANMHGCLRLSIRTDAMSISSVWTGLSNPELDPSQVVGGEEGIRDHPSTKMKELGSADGRSEEGWATVRIDARDWGKVMSVGRLGGRVIACEQLLCRRPHRRPEMEHRGPMILTKPQVFVMNMH